MDDSEHSIVRQNTEMEKRRSQLAKRGLDLISTFDSRSSPLIISVHSSRNSVGKSMVSTNLGTIMATQGLRVGILDANFEWHSLQYLFNLNETEIGHSLNDYLWGKCEIQDMVQDVTDKVGADIQGKIFLIPASMNPGEIARVLRDGYDIGLLTDVCRSLIKSLNLDVLLIETRASLSQDSLHLIAISNVLVEIMRPDEQDYRGTAGVMDVVRKLNIPRILLVINQVWSHADLDGIRNRVEQSYNCKVAAMLPFSEEMSGSGIFSLQFPDHEITLGLKKLTDQIANLSIPSLSRDGDSVQGVAALNNHRMPLV